MPNLGNTQLSKYQPARERYKTVISGIYSIVNSIDGKMYIGSAVIIQKRFSEHKLALTKNKHANRYLQFSWNKYGAINFKFEILEICFEEELTLREQFWMDFHCSIAPTGYNLKPFAISNLGMVHSAETRKKISEVQIGRKATAETKAKMSATRKGRKQRPEWIAKRHKAIQATKINKLFANIELNVNMEIKLNR